jgi:hypothetical protein
MGFFHQRQMNHTLRNRAGSQLALSRQSNRSEAVFLGQTQSSMQRNATQRHEFGVKGYEVPKPYYYDVNDIHIQNWKVTKIPPRGKGKKTYLDDVMTNAKKTQSTAHLLKPMDWKVASASMATHGHLHKNEFRKKKKETLNAEIMRHSKARKSPAPGEYEIPVPKIRSIPKYTEVKSLMILDAKWKAL